MAVILESDMQRYDTRIEDEILYVEGQNGWLEVGEMTTVCEHLGGETYTIEYDDHERSAAWLDTKDGKLTFDIRETLADISFDEEFVTNLSNVPLEEAEGGSHSKRSEYFTDMLQMIWDSKGRVGEGGETDDTW